ncbi:hypothetical protein COY62_04140 [bacterium (Candidatus Howlettbacteria) CG_4_10_14_0_8_um_filter_40_9]|nr:MAG: hypothetical protein COY62_04140 [bacterium (Candidatus Howlettbacteria) CG_4_10_14_0_8_um_filter_40_9]
MTKIKENEQGSLSKLGTWNMEQLTEGVLRHLAGLIVGEADKPNEKASWPRKMSVLLSNGENQLVAGKVEIRKFTDVQNSSKELGEFYDNREAFDTLAVHKDDGEDIDMPLDSESIFYVELGDKTVGLGKK